MSFNIHAIKAIYKFELHRFGRTLMTSLFVPAITTSLYFIVFGSAIGSRMTEVDGIPYGAFIVPGLIMLSMFTESISNASFGIYMPKFTGTIYELHSAPVSPLESVIAFVGAAATKSMFIGLLILATAHLFVDMPIAHPIATSRAPRPTTCRTAADGRMPSAIRMTQSRRRRLTKWETTPYTPTPPRTSKRSRPSPTC